MKQDYIFVYPIVGYIFIKDVVEAVVVVCNVWYVECVVVGT